MLAIGRQELLPSGGRVGAEPPARWAPEGGLAPSAGAPAQVSDTGARAAGHRSDALAGPQQELLRAAAGCSVPRAPMLPKPQLDAGVGVGGGGLTGWPPPAQGLRAPTLFLLPALPSHA